MKPSSCLLLSATAPAALAFPALGFQDLTLVSQDRPELLRRRDADRKNGPAPGFDAKAQHVETKGDHVWKAPNFSAGDQRGPCPGLNALANHNYLPRSGVATLTNFLEATNQVYGMGLDLSTFLAVFGTVFDGYPLAAQPGYSIGGPAPGAQNVLGNLGGLIGNPQGLSGSHNRYESDTSATRPDLYIAGQDYMVEVDQFQQYYDALVPGLNAINQYDRLYDFRISRFNHSINNNGYFFFSPFAGVLVAPAGYAFPPAFMANHSAKFPEGTLTKSSLMSFFGITGQPGSFKYNVGHERIPDNFYRRAIGDEYTIPGFLADVLSYAERDPRLLNVGGNTGKPNTFTPVDLGSLTNGAFETGTLLKGNNLECFVFQAINAAGPDFLSGLSADPQQAMSSISANIASHIAGLACPKLTKLNKKQYAKYPGYNRSGGAI